MINDQKKRTEGVGLVRILNEQIVLETILREGEISRPAIARKTGLSLPTVGSLVDSLESIGLVCQKGMVAGSVGRPANLYSVNPRAGYVFAVDLGGSKIRAGIANLFGDVITERVEPTKAGSVDSLVEQLTLLHHQLLAESGLDDSAPGAACIGVPGVCDPKTDRIDAAYNLPALNDLPLKTTFQQALEMPVTIENDVNLAAVGESWQGQASELDTFVAFSIGTGIGMGIVINGEVYRGRGGAAGEVGLLPIGPDPYDPQLRAGGPFEVAAAGPSIIRRLHKALVEGKETSLSHDANIAGIIDASEVGDEVAIDILNDEARTLAVGVAAIVSVLDPEIVIFGGGAGAFDKLAELVHSYALELISWMPPIKVSHLGNRSAFIGAVGMGLPVARNQVLTETRSRK